MAGVALLRKTALGSIAAAILIVPILDQTGSTARADGPVKCIVIYDSAGHPIETICIPVP
jgi:hypothetical protein